MFIAVPGITVIKDLKGISNDVSNVRGEVNNADMDTNVVRTAARTRNAPLVIRSSFLVWIHTMIGFCECEEAQKCWWFL